MNTLIKFKIPNKSKMVILDILDNDGGMFKSMYEKK